MNNPCRRYIQFIYTAAFITGCCFVMACENDEKRIKDLTEKVVTKEEATNIESYLSQDGQVKAKLKAPYMIRMTTDTVYVEFPRTLHCDFYDDSTRIETRLDSKYGKYFEGLNKVYLRDSVVVINIKGDTLKAPDLWWDQATQLFYTDKYAIYKGINKDIYGGKGLKATQDLSSIIFEYPTGTVKVPEGGFTQ
jgi:LPS export ABC transporter protein LptC